MKRRVDTALVIFLWAFFFGMGAKARGESFETAPIRPEGGDYVPPPFTPLAVEKDKVACLGRSYDLSGVIPMPAVGEKPVLQHAAVLLNGNELSPPPLEWHLRTPAVAIAERSWKEKGVGLSLLQTVEYDGFVTLDLTLAPTEPDAIAELSLRLEYRPETSTLYHIPSTRSTPAGFWPSAMDIDELIVGVWGGNDQIGFGSYVATFRHWHNPGAKVTLTRADSGPGIILYRVISEQAALDKPVTYRFGFMATPVRAPEKRHWQIYALTPGQGVEKIVRRLTFWSDLSDCYATFRTNKPDRDAERIAKVREAKEKWESVIAYTTYCHVEQGKVEVPKEWALANVKGQIISHSIGGGKADINRVFLCPGSRDWLEWKMEDLKVAVERYGVDGFYVDTSYVMSSCANALHDHGWVDDSGERQSDHLTWSMREVWRRSYEMLCKARGQAAIYAHHKAGCPPALAGFTCAFCDGEQYTSQSIKNLTLDAFRAQDAGRNMGPLAIFLNEYYRSAHFGLQKKAEHHNPTESLMLALLHDVLSTGYPGLHPLRELIALRDDLGIAEATWTPYYAPGRLWQAIEAKSGASDRVMVSSYRTARGDTLFVVGNPTYETVRVALRGPAEAREGRTFVAIDVLSRLGRASAFTAGYRWEKADPNDIEVGARSLSLGAFVREPEGLSAFAQQQGFTAKRVAERKEPIPEGARLVCNFDDPDWVMMNDDGELTATTDKPVDTMCALRIIPKPRHNAAAIAYHYAEPEDWTGCRALTFWVRPDQPLPVRSLEVRLRNANRYGPGMKLASHGMDFQLPPGQWTQLTYEFEDVPRNCVQILRLYYHRGEANTGPFDIDEMMLHLAEPALRKTEAKPATDKSPEAPQKAPKKARGGEEDKAAPD